jgi:hypothetical protein
MPYTGIGEDEGDETGPDRVRPDAVPPPWPFTARTFRGVASFHLCTFCFATNRSRPQELLILLQSKLDGTWGQSHRSSPALPKRRPRGHSGRSPLDLLELSESTVSILDWEPRQP